MGKWNKEREAEQLKRLKLRREEEEKWQREMEKEREERSKSREADLEEWRRRQREEEEARKKEEEDRLKSKEEEEAKRQRLSFSTLPIKETKTISFEKILADSSLQQSLLLSQRESAKEERKRNRVILTFTLSGIPEKAGQLESTPGWCYSNQLIIYRAKTWELPESRCATIDRIVIRALPENVDKSVTAKFNWFGWYEILPKKSMSIQTEDKQLLSVQTQTEVEDAIKRRSRTSWMRSS